VGEQLFEQRGSELNLLKREAKGGGKGDERGGE